MVDIISIIALVVSVLTVIGTVMKDVNLKHCVCFCLDSDCRDENINLDKQMKELNEKIERNNNKINKNKNKLDLLKNKKRLSNLPETPDSIISFQELEI